MSFLPRNQWNDPIKNDPIKPILVKSRDLLVSTYNLRLKHDSSSNLLTKLLIERKLEIFVEIYTNCRLKYIENSTYTVNSYYVGSFFMSSNVK